ncbi:MAG: helix-turn-helix domain-containing protein [Chloroflexi bacterium]|nr:helix-turn-helix domain-containing protein [Chloroflexota bacterium]
MNQLGEQLRAARESQGISLSQAAAETRILQRYIVALEDGDYQNLPGDVYIRGFIRNYAAFLGLSADELIECYRYERGRTDPIRIVPATSNPRVRGCVAPSLIGVFFVVLALVGVTYLVLSATNRIGESAQLAAAPTITPPPAPSPLPTVPPDATRPPLVSPTVTRVPIAGVVMTPAPTKTREPEAPIVLEVRIDPGDNPGSWLEIKTDGESVFRRVLAPGRSVRYTARRSVSVRAGNAAVVTVVINDQERRLGATPGEVVTFDWPP